MSPSPRPGRLFAPSCFVVMSLLMIVGGLFAVRADAAAWGPVQTLSPDGLTAEDVSLGTDDQGNEVAVWNVSDGSEEVIQAARRQPGGAWSAPVDLAPSAPGAQGAEVVVRPDGEAVAVWARQVAPPKYQVELARMDASGNWGAPVVISAGENAAAPALGLDGEGRAIVAWRQYLGNNYGAAVTVEEGGAWSTPQVLSDPATTNEAPAIAVDAAGDAVVSWGRNTAFEVSTRPVGGAWSAPVVLASGVGNVVDPGSVGIDDAGEATAVWTSTVGNPVVKASVAPLGGSWSPAVSLGTPTEAGPEPALAVDPAGKTLVTWVDETGGNYGIAVAERDAGGPWSPAYTLPSPEATLYEDQVAVDSEGFATVLFSGEREGSPVLWARQRPEGGAWGDPETISEAGEPATSIQVAVDEVGDAFAAWRTYGASRVIRSIGLETAATLTVTKSGSGSGTVSDESGRLDCGDICSARFRAGADVTLQATPATGYRFVGWSGACSGTDPCTISVGGSTSVGAEFGKDESPSSTAGPSTKPDSPKPPNSPRAGAPASPLRLVKVLRTKKKGVGDARFRVPAAGKLTVFGKGVKKRTVSVSGAGFRKVHLVPKGAFRHRLQTRHHRGFTRVKVVFRPSDGGPVVRQSRRVRLVWRP
jgi:hypothetical protein